jgi:hypothetical protein
VFLLWFNFGNARKDVLLASPTLFHRMATYSSQLDLPRRMYRFSQLDVRSETFGGDLFSAHVCAGEALFIPFAWFHDVVSERLVSKGLKFVFSKIFFSISGPCVSFNLFISTTKSEVTKYKWTRMFFDD